MMFVARIWHNVVSTLYPRLCAGCGRVLLSDEEHVCDVCRGRIAYTEHATHRGNRLELLFGEYNPFVTPSLVARKFVRGAAFAYYRQGTPIRRIERRIKFVGDPELARWMGRQMALRLQEGGFFEGIDCIIPIPLHGRRFEKRGFNQSEWLARGIRDVTGIEVDTTHLYRLLATEQQSRKNMQERRALPQPFVVLDANDLRAKHVLVVDDICTSGTTILRALELLRKIPGCHYSVATMAIAEGAAQGEPFLLP